MRADNMHLNDPKEQVYGRTQADRGACEALGGVAVEVARDLGFFIGADAPTPPW